MCCARGGDAVQRDGVRVLVFSKTAAFRHQSIEPGVEALRALASERGVRLDHTEDAGRFSASGLAPYDAVIFLSTTGDVLDDAQQRAFTEFLQDGNGFVGIHAASDTEFEWPWYGRLVGGYFQSHPNDPNVREGTLLVADPDHEATDMLPNPWIRTDEWYDIRDRQEGLTVLLDVDETSYKTADEDPAPEPRPIAWLHAFDGGRAFYTALGHTSESYGEPLFLEHVWRGLRYALGPAAARLAVP